MAPVFSIRRIFFMTKKALLNLLNLIQLTPAVLLFLILDKYFIRYITTININLLFKIFYKTVFNITAYNIKISRMYKKNAPLNVNR